MSDSVFSANRADRSLSPDYPGCARLCSYSVNLPRLGIRAGEAWISASARGHMAAVCADQGGRAGQRRNPAGRTSYRIERGLLGGTEPPGEASPRDRAITNGSFDHNITIVRDTMSIDIWMNDVKALETNHSRLLAALSLRTTFFPQLLRGTLTTWSNSLP